MVSYQWTGISDSDRIENLEKIVSFFEKQKKSIFCSDQFIKFFDLNNMGAENNYNFCLKAQAVSKNILFFINADNESVGMKKELEFAEENEQKGVLLLNKKFENLSWVDKFKKYSHKIIYFNGKFERDELNEIV